MRVSDCAVRSPPRLGLTNCCSRRATRICPRRAPISPTDVRKAGRWRLTGTKPVVLDGHTADWAFGPLHRIGTFPEAGNLEDARTTIAAARCADTNVWQS
jgi:hypothetical protein